MSEKLSILETRGELDADTNRLDVAADAAAAVAKGLLGNVPKIGPIVSEIVGTIIPNQKMDRLITFVRVLGDRVKYLEDDFVDAKMKTEEFTDLLEDALRQASRALTPERREYIASLLKNSITNEELTHAQEKKLLSLLGELNDAEIIFLKFYSLSQGQKPEFAERHKDLLGPVNRVLNAPQADVDKGALQDSYRNKLLEVGLLAPVYKRLDRNKLPEFDEKTGRMKATSFRVTLLGKLLLRYIEVDSAAESAASVAN